MKKYLFALAIVMLGLVAVGCSKSETPPVTQLPPTQEAPKPVGPPVVLPKDKTPEQYVTDYFNAYKEQRLEDAFKMQPAENKGKQPEKEFIALRKGMPIKEFSVLPTQKQGDSKLSVPVEYNVGQYGSWVSTWEFEKKGDTWTAVRYKAMPKQ